MSKRVTITDVAAEAGVSRATVSLVLREEPRVSQATRDRVHAAIERIGYVYDRRAAIMRTQRSMTIGVVVTNVRNPYFAELTMAIEEALQEGGFSVLLGYSQDEREREGRLLEVMGEHRVDGVILLPSRNTTAEDLRARLAQSAVPHVLIARGVADYDADYVGVDNVRAGELMGDHLGAQGFQRVAFLGGPDGSMARVDREAGLRRGFARHGLQLDPAYSIPAIADQPGGVAAVEALRAAGPMPDGIACYNDVVASGVLSALRAGGIAPGIDVGVGSFDDVTWSNWGHPTLTSVSTFPELVGAEAARLLQERIRSPALAPRQIVLTPRLVVRESSITRAAVAAPAVA